MRHVAQFERVQLICAHLKSERNGGEHTPNEAVSVAAAYLIACDRTDRALVRMAKKAWVLLACAAASSTTAT